MWKLFFQFSLLNPRFFYCLDIFLCFLMSFLKLFWETFEENFVRGLFETFENVFVVIETIFVNLLIAKLSKNVEN